MAFTAPLKVDADLKPEFTALRDALATLPLEKARAIMGDAVAQAQNPTPAEVPATVTSDAGIPASKPAPTVAKIRADSNAVLPTRRPSEPKPVEEGKVAIILRNDALMATHIAGKRYVIDAKLQVTPQELAAIEAELSQRPQRWGNYTRIERLEPA